MSDNDNRPEPNASSGRGQKELSHEEKMRSWAEWEATEDDRREHEREAALEEMVEWFHCHFEDPSNETPRDEGEFVFIWGGPFDASEVLFEEFHNKYESELIKGAINEVQKHGIYEWAPTSQGDFYEHPDQDDGASSSPDGATRESLLASISTLTKQLADLQTAPRDIGHNQPPEEIGSPPYADEDKIEIAQLLTITKEEILLEKPDVEILRKATSRLAEFSERAINYVGKKIDLAIDESIKKGIPITFSYLAFGEHLQNFIESVRTFLSI